MWFNKKKKEELHKGDVFLAKGIYLKQPVIQNGKVLMNCFLRSIVVFLLTFGSLGGFLSAFSISYNYPMVLIILLGLSFFFSWLYSLPKMVFRDLGYIFFFVLFLLCIFQLRFHANSGFYEIVNRILIEAQTFFELSGVRQYQITVDKPYLTIAIVTSFVGLVFIIILNIWLSSRVSVFWSFLITFPILFIPMYMRLVPDPLYIIILGVGYVCVLVFKANGHYLASPKGVSFYIKGFRKDRISYTQDSRAFRYTVFQIIVVLFCCYIGTFFMVPKQVFEGQFQSDPLREQTSEMIGNYVLLGFSSLYNRYASVGGMSGGQLGGVSNVTPDYMTDLIVTFAPYSNEAVYLKAYTGGTYGRNRWNDIYYESEHRNEFSGREVFEDESMKEEATMLRDAMYRRDEYSGMGKMKITNVGADIDYMYYPYYSLFQDYSEYENYGKMRSQKGIYLGENQTYYFYPKLNWEDGYGEKKPKEQNIEPVNSIYMDTPQQNAQAISKEMEAMGLHSDMTINEIVDTVIKHFSDNIPYTLKPGATPRDEDFVNYFLNHNRKGYCAHFATTATLIFRHMGIPARYVEGYAFGLETALISEENPTEKYFDYYKGYSSIGESTVLDVEVNDSMAHAWVEIYIDGFGWKIVEVTPGSNEASDESNFWDAFSSLLEDSDVDDLGLEEMFGDLNMRRYLWVFYLLIFILFGGILIRLVMILVRKIIRYIRCHGAVSDEKVIAYYADICDMLRTLNREFNACKSHREQLAYMITIYDVMIDVETYTLWIEKASFSQSGLGNRELLQLLGGLKQIRKRIWKQAKGRDWFSLLIR